jgi:glycosyltransferase involved in cell wall biosynthesis
MRSSLTPPPVRSTRGGLAPSLSVVLAAYEAAACVGGAVESVLRQTLPPKEVIVVDDGSTDDLRGALAAYAEKITILRKENGGLASARNTGIRAASGDFIAFLDADNAYLPEFLEAVSELATKRPDLDIITTDAYLELDGKVYGRYYRGKARFIVEDQRRGIIHQHFIFGNGAIHRDALLRVGGYDETVVAEDTDLFVRMILGGSRAGLIDEPLCYYRIRQGSLSSSRPRMLAAGVVVLERARDHPTLTPEERRYLEGELAAKRREAGLAAAEEALRGFARHPRRRALAVAFGRSGYRIASRVSALAAALAPRLAGRYLERLDHRFGRSRLSLRTHGR